MTSFYKTEEELITAQPFCFRFTTGGKKTGAAPLFGRSASCGKCILTAPSLTPAKQRAVCLTALKPCLFPCLKISLTTYPVTEVSLS